MTELISPNVQAFVKAAESHPEAFWAEAAEALPWHRRWERVLEWDPEHPDERRRYFRWFVGGETNLAYNAVDRHVESGVGGRAALVCEDERGGRAVLTYAQLRHAVAKTAAALRGLGVGKGDRVGIYMPTCREAIVLMLACVRIGAIHIAVFAGFGAGALGDRLALAGAKVLFCSDLTYRKGKDVPLKGDSRPGAGGGGPAVIGDLNFVSMLPKTRSGKIMRRVLKAVTLERDPGDISTIEDAGSVSEARAAWDTMRSEITRGSTF